MTRYLSDEFPQNIFLNFGLFVKKIKTGVWRKKEAEVEEKATASTFPSRIRVPTQGTRGVGAVG
jgi:hypothetical protein